MVWQVKGAHLIAGDWVMGAAQFASEPASGAAQMYSVGSVAHVAAAVAAAQAAFADYAARSREDRAAFLDAIAEEIDLRGADITEIGAGETGLPEARLVGERGRTVGQLRLFASHIRAGAYLDQRVDAALPDRAPMPRPEIRLMQRPVGPVAVFGASNFPLAFSVAGGDTASALAAGCPVVVKGHSAHPGTGEIIAEAILAAIARCDMPRGVFSLIQGGDRKVGSALVTAPEIKAVGFTGSLVGGRALFDLCAQRDEPIPFFGELGSVNPMFLLPEAISARGEAIAQGWAGSLTMGAGQFCTNPGIAVIRADQAEGFAQATVSALAQIGPQVMLTNGIAQAYVSGTERVANGRGVQSLLAQSCGPREARPQLFLVKASDWLADHALAEEVFGPLGVIVACADAAEMEAVARSFKGQLTATLQVDAGDAALAKTLLPILERMAGRVLANGFPTGVEVCEAMVHGGPYPASTNFGATSVGTMSIRRWLRPVSYQNLPEWLWPSDLA